MLRSGTGKTMMAIAAAAVAHEAGLCRTLVLSPPHLVYKWRREILKTVPNARVWILDGTDTLAKLLQIRAMREARAVPEFLCWAGCGCAWATIGGRPIQYANSTALLRMPPAMKTSASTVLFCCPRCSSEIRDDRKQGIRA